MAQNSARHVIVILVLAVACASTGMFASITLGAIAAVETTGSRSASGIPAAVGIAGTALGALWLGAFMGRRGRRAGLRLGWLVGVPGGLLAAVAVQTEQFLLLLPAMFAIGAANGGSQLARYAAAEVTSPERRASSISWVVWAATIGAIGGPLLLGPIGNLSESLGAAPGTGGFVFVTLAMLGALGLAMLLPDIAKTGAAAPAPSGSSTTKVDSESTSGISVAAKFAIAGLIAAQAAMVGVMAITPVHLTDGHHQYGVVGTVMSGHFVGMFALAPIVGWLVDRAGAGRVMFAGHGTLIAGALLAAWLPLEHGAVLSVPLFLVGVGWSACFVSTSSVIAGALPEAGRARAQGRIDSLVWGAAATSSLLSGLLLAWTSYAVVAICASMLVALTAIAVALAGPGRRSAPAA